MKTKLKLIVVTAVCTTVGWVVIIAALFVGLFGWGSRGGPAATLQFPRPGDLSTMEWQALRGDFIVRMVSSNVTTSATSVLYSCTSRAPERIWFESLRMQPGDARKL